MININKSQPAPDCLATEKTKASGDYKCGDVLERIKTDFLNKCYICECPSPITINVEHFIPHKGNIDLKFDWNNLFWVCGHCNNTKLARYDNILNCTNPAHDVVNWIRYKIEPYPHAEAYIIAVHDEEAVRNTVELLDAVYNGTTLLKEIEGENLREVLVEEMLKFQDMLVKYFKRGTTEKEKKKLCKKIKKHLARTSAFTAFKCWVILDNRKLRQEFEQYFD